MDPRAALQALVEEVRPYLHAINSYLDSFGEQPLPASPYVARLFTAEAEAAAARAEALLDEAAEVCAVTCFPAGTPVVTSNGPVPIEHIRVSDEVLSRNRQTGKLEYKKVTALVPPHPSRLLQMYLAGEANPLQPTPEHPFFIRHSGASQAEWVRASQIQVGDFVLTAAGAWTEVLAISPLDKEQLVYNFEVEENHDYFVGSAGLLVHNGNCATGNAIHQTFRDFLTDLTDTDPADWKMATAPGETGVDATYIGDVDIGFEFAELKPDSPWGLDRFGDQLERWGLPDGSTALFLYNTTTFLINPSYFLF